MRVLAVCLLFLLALLSGCSDGGGEPVDGGTDADGDAGGSGDGADAGGLVPLRFAAEDRTPRSGSLTFTVGPDDACLPAGCPLGAAAGTREPAHLKLFDVSEWLPQGMHALVEVRAVYEPHETDAVDVDGNWELRWHGADLWFSGTQRDNAAGNATLSGYVTNHGPEPALLALAITEPDGGAEDVEVTVHVRVTPLDDAVHASHVVGLSLSGGAVPVTTELDGEAVLMVRGPDDEPLLMEPVENGTVVTLPEGSPPGEYRFTTFETDGLTRFLVPEENRTSSLMRPLDTTPEDGQARALPPNGPLTWTVDLARPPYLFRVVFDGYDGRSTTIDADFTVTAPDGTVLVEDDVFCRGCIYARSVWGTVADDALTAGTYTVTVDVATAQGWTVREAVGLYGI